MTAIAPSTALIDVLANRRSTRVFDAQRPIDESALSAALEAARWAPSAANTQPWRMIVARRGSDAFEQISASLTGFNQVWAVNAGALVVFLADTEHDGVEWAWRSVTRATTIRVLSSPIKVRPRALAASYATCSRWARDP